VTGTRWGWPVSRTVASRATAAPLNRRRASSTLRFSVLTSVVVSV